MPSIRSSAPAETIECETCRRECYPEEQQMTKLNGFDQCEDCRKVCAGDCGEFIADETIAIGGPLVHFRDYLWDGKLVAAHASCAAITLLGYIDPSLDYDRSTREEIADAVAAMHQLAVTA